MPPVPPLAGENCVGPGAAPTTCSFALADERAIPLSPAPGCSKTIDAGEIDAINILQAALKAMEGAAAGLPEAPDFLLVDGNRLPKARSLFRLFSRLFSPRVCREGAAC